LAKRLATLMGPAASLRGRLIRGGLGSLALKLGSTALGFLLAILLARTLGPEGYGVYAFVFAIVSLLAIPTQLGLPQLVVRETAKAQAAEQWGLMRGLWRWSTLAVWLFSSGVLVLAFAGLWLFGERLDDLPARPSSPGCCSSRSSPSATCAAPPCGDCAMSSPDNCRSMSCVPASSSPSA